MMNGDEKEGAKEAWWYGSGIFNITFCVSSVVSEDRKGREILGLAKALGSEHRRL